MAYAGIETGGAGLFCMSTKHAKFLTKPINFNYRPHLLFHRLQSTATLIKSNCSYSGKNVYSSKMALRKLVNRFSCKLSVASATGLRGVLELPKLHAGYATGLSARLQVPKYIGQTSLQYNYYFVGMAT